MLIAKIEDSIIEIKSNVWDKYTGDKKRTFLREDYLLLLEEGNINLEK